MGCSSALFYLFFVECNVMKQKLFTIRFLLTVFGDISMSSERNFVTYAVFTSKYNTTFGYHDTRKIYVSYMMV